MALVAAPDAGVVVALPLAEQLWKNAKLWLIEELKEDNPCSYFHRQLGQGTARQDFAKYIHDCHNAVALEQRAPPWIHEVVAPAPNATGISRHQLLLVQLAIGEDACPRGSPSADCCLEIFDRNVLEGTGNQTDKYPLEVHFGALGLQTGQAVGDFAVGLVIGFGTTLACYLTLWATLRWESWSSGVTHAALVTAWGPQLLKVLRLHCTWDPPADTMALIMKSLGGKIAAANRQRPNPCQMHSALLLRVREVTAEKVRLAPAAVWDFVILAYNKAERIRTCKLQADEVAVIKLLGRSAPAFVDLVRHIWGTDRIGSTSIPLLVISSKFLDAAAEVAVDAKANPLWHGVLQVTEEKKLLFVQRTHGRFLAKAWCCMLMCS
jgi:hypothetical protein